MFQVRAVGGENEVLVGELPQTVQDLQTQMDGIQNDVSLFVAELM